MTSLLKKIVKIHEYYTTQQIRMFTNIQRHILRHIVLLCHWLQNCKLGHGCVVRSHRRIRRQSSRIHVHTADADATRQNSFVSSASAVCIGHNDRLTSTQIYRTAKFSKHNLNPRRSKWKIFSTTVLILNFDLSTRWTSVPSFITVRRYALHGLSYRNSVRPSVRPSVCLSHSCTVSTWFNLRSWFLHHMVATSF